MRIDYIALPKQIPFQTVQTWVAVDIDISLQRLDHLPVLCKVTANLQVPTSTSTARLAKKMPSPDDGSFSAAMMSQSIFHHFGNMIDLPPWYVDPHATADALASSTIAAVQELVPRTRRQPRKRHLSDTTWRKVDEKKLLFQQLRALKRTRRHTFLRQMFTCWKTRQPCSVSDQQNLASWMILHDHAFATTTSQLKRVALLVTAAIREEDALFYQNLAHEAAATYSVEGLTSLWKRLKAVLPKHRSRRAAQRFDFDDRLQHHFEQLEAGTTTTHDESRMHCYRRNQEDVQSKPDLAFVDIMELPTLFEIEDLCLRLSPNKAAGPDGLSSNICRYGAAALAPHLHSTLLKAFLSGIEPHRYKGGNLVPIWKQKGNQQDPASYRGILLSDSFGKVYHAWLRKRLLPTLLQSRATGQLGGLPSQQTVSGIQMLRLHGRLGRAKRISTAVIFVDLRSAFHHLLREFVFNNSRSLELRELQTFFDSMDFDLPQLARDLFQATQQPQFEVPPALASCLAEVHQGTWFRLDGAPGTTDTRRGTRPGSPLADIGFNLLMTKLIKLIQSQLDADPVYRAGQVALGAWTPLVTWVDDLAVPLATSSPQDLAPLIQRVVAVLFEVFQTHGLAVNMDCGKTEVVLMYRGRAANPLRSAMFDNEVAPALVTATASHVLTIRVVPSYKHLGARYSMDLDANQEVSVRSAMARQAFESLRKQIFTNKHIPIKARLQLYDSLVLSRLLYGCSVWSDLNASQVAHLETLLIGHHRRMHNIGFWSETHMSDLDFCRSHNVQSFRILWARHRLVYLQHLAQHALPAHRDLLLAEYATGKGWLHEVCADLQWLSTLTDLPFEVPQISDGWQMVWDILASWRGWKTSIKRACARHLVQEKLAWEVQRYHVCIIDELERNDAIISRPEDELPPDETVGQTFTCTHCSASFATRQRLAVHENKKHGLIAEERWYIQSSVCAGCLKDFHTSARVLAHLRYRRNGCWDRLYQARAPADPVHVELPAHLLQVKRIPAIRRHHGPLRPTSNQRWRLALGQRIRDLRALGEPEYAWWMPEPTDAVVLNAMTTLRQALCEWCALPEPDDIAFQNIMFAALFSLGLPDAQASRLFIHWVERFMYDDCPADLDPDYIVCLERAHFSMLQDLYTWELRQQMHDLLQLWAHKPPDYPDFEPRPSPQHRRPYNRQRCVSTLFDQLRLQEVQRWSWRIIVRPRVHTALSRGHYYIVHLYSGRRRPHDFHAWMEWHLAHNQPHLQAHVSVLSLDTAIDEDMNIHSAWLWNKLLDMARSGLLLALLLGPPCETWSAARFHALENSLRSGPRPLRSLEALWGLDHRTMAELHQLDVGNCLLLKGLWLCVATALHNGSVILEHPAMPIEEAKPSIWRTGILRLLLRGRYLFRRITVAQWRYGAVGVKPTTFLHCHGDLPHALRVCELPGATRPDGPLLGRDANGAFRTARAKEYPPALCESFARCFSDRLRLRHLGEFADADPELAEFVRVSACLEGSMMPDYQPV